MDHIYSEAVGNRGGQQWVRWACWALYAQRLESSACDPFLCRTTLQCRCQGTLGGQVCSGCWVCCLSGFGDLWVLGLVGGKHAPVPSGLFRQAVQLTALPD
jgi:hypothetical protein